MSYSSHPVDPTMPQPRISNISFINVTATKTRVVAGLTGAFHPIEGLHFESCNFHATSEEPWVLNGVDVESCSSVATTPAFPGGKSADAIGVGPEIIQLV